MIVFVFAGFLAGCATLPKDNAQLTEMKWDGLMGSRYTEFLLVFGDAVTREYMAGVYNTTGLNGANPAGGHGGRRTAMEGGVARRRSRCRGGKKTIADV